MTISSSEKGNVNENETEKPGDIFRNAPLRYIGYMGHLGWICRTFIPHHLTSMATVTYVCADAFVRTTASAARGESDRQIITTAGDVFLWHFLASLLLPGVFLHGVNSVTCQMRSLRSKCRPRSQFYLLPCFLSSLLIPFIVSPIDRAVDEFMNKYIRNSNEIKESYMEISDDCEDEDQSDLKFKWFYEQSKDQHILELERYQQKLKDEKEREQTLGRNIRDIPNITSNNANSSANAKPNAIANTKPNANSSTNASKRNSLTDSVEPLDGLKTKSVQVDKTTRPPKPPKAEKIERIEKVEKTEE